jgi:2-dehydropantoate 2-reductase|nr:2-dehydropantoate 2-reductase N-terminal domain-containing protein [Kofleriaceae bacterium]
MRLVVVGAGAVGGALAARLWAAKRDVVVVARGDHGAAIRARGLRLDGPDGSITATVASVARIGELEPRAGDVALMCVKTQDVAGAADELIAAGFEAAPVACLTNGLEAERACARRFADVHAVVVMSPCEHLSPGLVRQWAAPLRGVLDLGRYPSGHDDVDAALADAFREAGYRSDPQPEILRSKRTKLLLNLGNAIEALVGPGGRDSELARAARAEGVAVFRAAGLAVTSDADDAARRDGLLNLPIGDEARRGGSTWQSLARGAPLETDYLNGEIVLLGRLHGVATPVNARLQRAVRRATAPGAMRLDDI